MTTESDVTLLPDYTVEGGGTVYLLRAMNEEALKNLQDGTSEEAQWMGHAVAVEHRYIAGIVERLREDGWRVA